MNRDTSFYLTCVSNDSKNQFSSNTPSTFTTRLSQPITLSSIDRDWEVALSSLTYPYLINNVGVSKEMRMYVFDGRTKHVIELPDAYVFQVPRLAEYLEESVNKYFRSLDEDSLLHNETPSTIWQLREEEQKEQPTSNFRQRADAFKAEHKNVNPTSLLEQLNMERQRHVERRPIVLHEGHSPAMKPAVSPLYSGTVVHARTARTQRVRRDLQGMTSENPTADAMQLAYAAEPSTSQGRPVERGRKRVHELGDEYESVKIDSEQRRVTNVLQVTVDDDNCLKLKWTDVVYDFALSPSLAQVMGFDVQRERTERSLDWRICFRSLMELTPTKFRSYLTALKQATGDGPWSSGVASGRVEGFMNVTLNIKGEDWEESLRTVTYDEYWRDISSHDYEKTTQGEFVTLWDMLLKEELTPAMYNDVASVATTFELTVASWAMCQLLRTAGTALHKGQNPVLLMRGEVAYIYTNIIRTEHVGTRQARLLDMVTIGSSNGEMMNQILFADAHYKLVDADGLQDIKIAILNSYGRPVSFCYEPVTVQLHFRRRRPLTY